MLFARFFENCFGLLLAPRHNSIFWIAVRKYIIELVQSGEYIINPNSALLASNYSYGHIDYRTDAFHFSP